MDPEDGGAYTMPVEEIDCAAYDPDRTDYDSGNFVCTVNPAGADAANNGYDQFVWRCASENLCNGVTPAEDTAWFLTRNRGQIVGWAAADYYEYEQNWPYAHGEVAMHLDVMYSCIDNRGGCGFYTPGVEFANDTFDGYLVFYPWAPVTDKIVGDRIYKSATDF